MNYQFQPFHLKEVYFPNRIFSYGASLEEKAAGSEFELEAELALFGLLGLGGVGGLILDEKNSRLRRRLTDFIHGYCPGKIGLSFESGSAVRSALEEGFDFVEICGGDFDVIRKMRSEDLGEDENVPIFWKKDWLEEGLLIEEIGSMVDVLHLKNNLILPSSSSNLYLMKEEERVSSSNLSFSEDHQLVAIQHKDLVKMPYWPREHDTQKKFIPPQFQVAYTS